jgi:CheY-like chemotaxis protein
MYRILVIDDDEDMRSLLQAMLRKYSVLQAANGREGMEVFRTHAPDLVITDLIMPEKEGIETIVELRREQPEAKIIAISGGGGCLGRDYLCFAQQLGVKRTLSKPFRPQELLQAVEEVLSA